MNKTTPTLFIALGGTGAEIALRLRHRILTHTWGCDVALNLIGGLDEFPLAQFIYYDLTDDFREFAGPENFSDHEKLINKLDLNKYFRNYDDLDRYPQIAEWFPCSRRLIEDLCINPSYGAGQLRCLSRLYFFDKYINLKNAILEGIQFLDFLCFRKKSKYVLKCLEVKIEPNNLRIVLLASTAGGTGSGSFLDMGYLAKWLAKEHCSEAKVDLFLMLPGGFLGFGERKKANTYAALMELETCMQQGAPSFKRWSCEQTPDMPRTPFDNIFLFDSTNLVRRKVYAVSDLYDMAADVLFEDLALPVIAERRRSFREAKQQYKYPPFTLPVDSGKFTSMKIHYSKAYSTFGRSVIDMGIDRRRDEITRQQANEMLKAFFGLNSSSRTQCPPTKEDVDEFLANRMCLGVKTEKIDYDFIVRDENFRKGVERITFPLVTELLRCNGIDILCEIDSQIWNVFEEIRSYDNCRAWRDKIVEAIDSINHQYLGSTESCRGIHEDSIRKRRDELMKELMDPCCEISLSNTVWQKVDDTKRGGLDYTIELSRCVKDRLDNELTGLIKIIEENARYFTHLMDILRNDETECLLMRLGDAANRLFAQKNKSEPLLIHLAEAVRLYVRYYLYAVACREAVCLLRELSRYLGTFNGCDENGEPVWGGLIGELVISRKSLCDIINETEEHISSESEANRNGSSTCCTLNLSSAEFDTVISLDPILVQELAQSALQDFGNARKILQMLGSREGRSIIFKRLQVASMSRLPVLGRCHDNPLFKLLEEMTTTARRALFQSCLEMALPWADADVDRTWKVDPSQYFCIVTVNNAEFFRTTYGREFRSVVPECTRMNDYEFKFYETDILGKLTCYAELSGMPLLALKDLPVWRASYGEEDMKIPVHLHKDNTLFVHPLPPSMAELDRLAEDFKLFIQGIALGAFDLTQGHECLYRIHIQGEQLSIGNERLIRMAGLPVWAHEFLSTRVQQSSK